MEKQSIINLKPVFVTTEEEYIPRLNSVFLYIFLFFQFIVIVLLIWYFFKIEIIFLYTKIFTPEKYREEEKKTYNNYMYALKNIITTNVFCVKQDENWYPKYDSGKNMLTLDQKNIMFNNEEACKTFIAN